MRYVATFLLGGIVVGFALYFTSMQPPGDDAGDTPVLVDTSDDSVAEALTQNLEDALAKSDARVAQLEQELDEANAQIAQLTESLEDTEMDEAVEASPEDAEDEDGTPTLDEIRAKLAENGMAQAQIKALTEMMYGDFINSLDVDAEAKEELRAALAQSFMEQMALSQYAMQNGEIPWSEVKGWELEERGYLNDQLREILSADQYRSWEEYAKTTEERQLDGALRTQIKNFASGLTPENFDIVMQVAIEEFRAEQIALEQSTTPFTMNENVMYQIRAMQAMRERLQGYLPADQFAEIENWLNMAENLLMSQLPQDGQ